MPKDTLVMTQMTCMLFLNIARMIQIIAWDPSPCPCAPGELE